MTSLVTLRAVSVATVWAALPASGRFSSVRLVVVFLDGCCGGTGFGCGCSGEVNVWTGGGGSGGGGRCSGVVIGPGFGLSPGLGLASSGVGACAGIVGAALTDSVLEAAFFDGCGSPGTHPYGRHPALVRTTKRIGSARKRAGCKRRAFMENQ